MTVSKVNFCHLCRIGSGLNETVCFNLVLCLKSLLLDHFILEDEVFMLGQGAKRERENSAECDLIGGWWLSEESCMLRLFFLFSLHLVVYLSFSFCLILENPRLNENTRTLRVRLNRRVAVIKRKLYAWTSFLVFSSFSGLSLVSFLLDFGKP